MNIKLPDILSQVKKRNNINSLFTASTNHLENNRTIKPSSASNTSNINNHNNTNTKFSSQAKEVTTQTIKAYQLENVESEDLIKAILKRFSHLDKEVRHDFILKIFKDCDSDDMTFIYEVKRII